MRLELKQKIKVAKDNGLGESQSHRLTAILEEYEDVIRLEFGQDPPLKVDPLRVRLREDATPVGCRLRRYATLYQRFFENHTKKLANAGQVFGNHRSR